MCVLCPLPPDSTVNKNKAENSPGKTVVEKCMTISVQVWKTHYWPCDHDLEGQRESQLQVGGGRTLRQIRV